MPKRQKPKPKTNLDFFDIWNLDLDKFLSRLGANRGLFPVLTGLAKACQDGSVRCQRFLDKEQPSPGVRVLIEDEMQFFDDARTAIATALDSLETKWKGREMPRCANGEFRFSSKRAGAAIQAYLETLIGTVNDLDATYDERAKAARQLAGQAGSTWIDQAGKPNFEMARAFDSAVTRLAEPMTPEVERRAIAAQLQEFIFTNGERLRCTGE